MAYSANKLITTAFYLSSVRSKDFMNVGGDDISVGLDLLNKVLAGASANTRMIPYYKEYETPALIGVEKYFIPGLVEPLSMTFNMGPVRFSTSRITRQKYHGTSRIDGVISLPTTCSFERRLNGSDMYVQFLPADNYPFKIWGKFALDSITFGGEHGLDSDLSLVYDLWYIDYLENLLAKRLCSFYGQPMNPEIQNTLNTIAANINDMNPLDMSSGKINRYDDTPVFNWITEQLSNGYIPN